MKGTKMLPMKRWSNTVKLINLTHQINKIKGKNITAIDTREASQKIQPFIIKIQQIGYRKKMPQQTQQDHNVHQTQ